MKGKFGKIGLLSVAVLLALGAIGVGLAHWQETQTIDSTVKTGIWKEVGGSPGFWNHWDSHKTYTEAEILDLLAAIDAQSLWLAGITNISQMEAVFAAGEGGTMEQKFLRHYLATRLNTESRRLHLETFHLFSSHDPVNYLSLGMQGTLEEIIYAIEGKYGKSPTQAEFEIMKDICDALNNMLI